MPAKILLLIAIATLGFTGFSAVAGQVTKPDLVAQVKHFYQSTIRISGEKTVYFDPVNVPTETHDADIVFVTHTHGDHFSVLDIQKIMKPETVLVIPVNGVIKAKAAGIKNITEVLPNKEYAISGINFKTVPAYNINNGFHPKENNWVGYIVEMNKTTYYDAGDTDLIPEMKEIKADVVFLPVGGTYTMTAKEAAEAANLMKPTIAVPIHFADVVGTMQDAKDFVGLLNKDIQGVILKN